MKVQKKKLTYVAISRKEGVATVTLNRPDKLNALSPDLEDDLIEALGELAVDDTVRALIITGAGKSFSAGGDAANDIDPLRYKSLGEFYYTSKKLMYKIMFNMEKPIIAAINGYAVGAGMELTLCCDIRIAAEDAKLGEFFVRMGLIPEIGVYLLPLIVGLGKAKYLVFTGELVDAREAERIGLVDKVVPPDKLMSSAEELAERLARGPKAIGLMRRAIHESLGETFNHSFDTMQNLFYRSVHTEDHAEAITAYLEKRKPVFKGR